MISFLFFLACSSVPPMDTFVAFRLNITFLTTTFGTIFSLTFLALGITLVNIHWRTTFPCVLLVLPEDLVSPFQAAGHFPTTERIVTHDIKIQAGSPLYVHIDRNKKARAERKLAKREANRVAKRGKLFFLDLTINFILALLKPKTLQKAIPIPEVKKQIAPVLQIDLTAESDENDNEDLMRRLNRRLRQYK